MFGRPISVRPSKHRDISMPRGLAGTADDVAAAALSVDFTDQPVHRFRNAVAAAHNAKNVCAPGPVLHLSSLPESATDQSIRELFAQYGQVCVCVSVSKDDYRVSTWIIFESPCLCVVYLYCLCYIPFHLSSPDCALCVLPKRPSHGDAGLCDRRRRRGRADSSAQL
jgi:hypothetical protein